MKTIIKKVWVVLIMLCCASTSAFAYDFEVDGFAYTITSFTDLTVSVSVDTLKNKEITSVSIPSNVEYKGKSLTVTGIDRKGFSSISTLVEVILPNTIINIGAYAFEDCSALTKITIPPSVQSIAVGAFYGCSSLDAISIPTELKGIDNETFYGCTSLKSFELPSGITSIGDGAFYRCTSLKSIELPSGIKSIGSQAFSYSGLKQIDIPASVTTLGNYVFSGCPFEKIELPSSIKKIPKGCFSGCSQLTDVIFSASSIGENAFWGTGLQEFNPTAKIVSIGEDAFRNCTNLKKFVIPSGVTNVDPEILWYCPKIETLQIGSGLSGLPVYYKSEYIEKGKYSKRYNTIGSYYYYKPSRNSLDETIRTATLYLQSLKNFIIDDSQENFSMGGYYNNNFDLIPAFTNITLDYFYAGRPLIDIKDWSINSTYDFKVDNIKQGYGRIKKLEISGYCESVPYFYQKIDTLKLGGNVKTINIANIYTDDLKQIECISNIPPKIVNGTFPTHVFTDVILYVPYGCKDVYAKSDVWKNFWNIKESDSSSVVESIDITNDHDKLFRVYNLYGILVKETQDMSDIQSLPKGLYIVNGKKIIVN